MVGLFPARIRVSGISFTYNIAYALWASTTPLLLIALMSWSPWICVIYCAVMGAVGVVSAVTSAAVWVRKGLRQREKAAWLTNARTFLRLAVIQRSGELEPSPKRLLIPRETGLEKGFQPRFFPANLPERAACAWVSGSCLDSFDAVFLAKFLRLGATVTSGADELRAGVGVCPDPGLDLHSTGLRPGGRQPRQLARPGDRSGGRGAAGGGTRHRGAPTLAPEPRTDPAPAATRSTAGADPGSPPPAGVPAQLSPRRSTGCSALCSSAAECQQRLRQGDSCVGMLGFAWLVSLICGLLHGLGHRPFWQRAGS